LEHVHQYVHEYGQRFIKSNTVLLEVLCRFLRIPLKLRRHQIVLSLPASILSTWKRATVANEPGAVAFQRRVGSTRGLARQQRVEPFSYRRMPIDGVPAQVRQPRHAHSACGECPAAPPPVP